MASTEEQPQHSETTRDELGKTHDVSVFQYLRSMSVKLAPVAVCLGAVPVLVLLSLVAGWLVWKSVPKGWSLPVFLQYGDGGPPFYEFEIASLSNVQPYNIALHLSVPAYEANYDLGNFMIALRMSTLRNTTIVETRKPALVLSPRPRPRLIFLSHTPRLVEIDVPLVSSVVTGVDRAIVRIEVGRRDGWKTIGSGEGRELSVYSASLYGTAHPQGMARMLAAFPLSLSVTASLAFFCISALCLAVFLSPAIRVVEKESPEEEPKKNNSDREIMSALNFKREGDDEHDNRYPFPEPQPRHRTKRSASVPMDE